MERPLLLEQAGFTPGITQDELEWKSIYFKAFEERLEVQVPSLTVQQLKTVVNTVRSNRESYLKNRSLSDVIEAMDRAVHLFLDPNSEFRKKANHLLPIVTGYDARMVSLGLTSYLKTFRRPQLLKFVQQDFPNPLLLDEFFPQSKGGYSKAFGPNLLLHVWAGNVPGLPLWSLLSGFLVKSASIGKVASAEPLFASLFLQALSEVDPKLAACCAIVWWKGGDEVLEEAALEEAEVVIGYGSNESLASLRSRTPITTRFLAYGHKISFGMAARESLDARRVQQTVHLAATDVMRYDQQGCYSPRLFFVERGGRVSPADFAQMMAQELRSFEQKYPRRLLSLEEATEVSHYIQSAEFELLQQNSDESSAVYGSSDSPWAVFYEERLRFLPSPAFRTIRVIAVDWLQDAIGILEPARDYLQTVGVAANPERLFDIANLLGEKGVTRICALGNMTAPEAGWHHDGRFNLLDLVRIVDIEESAQLAAEPLAPYVE